MHKLTQSYQNELARYEDYRTKAEILIRELLVQNSINYHKIESRIKDVSKLDEKIIRKNDKYKNLEDITDLVGLRVITYFEDEVDKVAQLIESEFILDRENSIDKRMSESDRFGYKSLHYVISLSKERKKLMEYKRFKDIKIEVQIRSILQHAWAEIEHDIGYKGELAIPDQLKRNFYRVAALLETADLEFINIRNRLNEYESTVQKEIQIKPENVDLNAASLRSFIDNSPIVHELDEDIAKNQKCQLENDFLDIPSLLKQLHFLNIRTVKNLETAFIGNKNDVPSFAKLWFGDDDCDGYLRRGISIFYLCYVLIGRKADLDLASNYFSEHDLLTPEENNVEVGKQLLDTYRKIKREQ